MVISHHGVVEHNQLPKLEVAEPGLVSDRRRHRVGHVAAIKEYVVVVEDQSLAWVFLVEGFIGSRCELGCE